MVAGSDGPAYYVKNYAYDGDDYQVKLEQLRPRARKVLSRSDLELGMDVLVNYNMNEPSKRGIWVAGKASGTPLDGGAETCLPAMRRL